MVKLLAKNKYLLMKTKINLYTNNHAKNIGIEDFVSSLQYIFSSREIDLKINNQLEPNATNIIIDEFTNVYKNLEINKFAKSYPDTKLIFILTEFIEQKFLVKSFNHFGTIFDSALLAWINIALRKLRKDFISNKKNDYLIGLILLPFLPISILQIIFGWIIYLYVYLINDKKTRKKLKNLRSVHKLIYMHMRYLGLESMISNADGLILSHEKIKEGLSSNKYFKNVPVLSIFYPECNKNNIENISLSKKNLNFAMTGTMTNYRKWELYKLNIDMLLMGLNNQFGRSIISSFDDRQYNNNAFSFHPPQSKYWKYSSPTRLYRAIFIHGNIPVITKFFNQHPIEKACIYYTNKEQLIDIIEIFKYPEEYKNYLQKFVSPYLEVARKNNDNLVDKILQINSKYNLGEFKHEVQL